MLNIPRLNKIDDIVRQFNKVSYLYHRNFSGILIKQLCLLHARKILDKDYLIDTRYLPGSF
jgi:hypothetical protein